MTLKFPRALPGALLALVLVASAGVTGCSKKGAGPGGPAIGKGSGDSTATVPSQPLPDSAYDLNPKLTQWIDPDTGYDATRKWTLDGTEYPVLIIMSPSQSPQFLVGMRDGIFQKKMKPFGIELTMDRIDGPPRTFHALERSKWPFVYAPLAVYMDYVRSADNQGGAAGLQYVLLASSTAGGGYTLISKDPEIQSVADLKGKTVGLINYNPVPGTLLTSAVKRAGMKVGDGPDMVKLVNGPDAEQMNKFTKDQYDALVSLNIYVPQFLQMGAHKVTDFSKDTDYIPNYNVLMVERSVLENKPEVVKAFLEAHAQAQKVAAKQWDSKTVPLLYQNWNDFFSKEKTPYAKDRLAKDIGAFKLMLGDMRAEDRLDATLVKDCFAYLDRNGTWGWPGKVDTSKIYDPAPYKDVTGR